MNILWVAITSFIVNIPLGIWRSKYKKFSFMWFLLIHASIPLIVSLRIYLDTPTAFIPLFIVLAVFGQMFGKKLNYKKYKSVEPKK
jgi:hypothetical protein